MLVYIFGTFYFSFFMLHLYVADVHNIYNILISKSFKLTYLCICSCTSPAWGSSKCFYILMLMKCLISSTLNAQNRLSRIVFE